MYIGLNDTKTLLQKNKKKKTALSAFRSAGHTWRPKSARAGANRERGMLIQGIAKNDVYIQRYNNEGDIYIYKDARERKGALEIKFYGDLDKRTTAVHMY